MTAQKLYGRERELAALLDAFNRMAATGHCELVLVSGDSGIGKTSLVQELPKANALVQDNFISGKFDQSTRDIPCAPIAQALRERLDQISSDSEASVAGWRRALEEALGENGQVIVQVVPQLESILGAQPAVPELPPTEAQDRFRRVLRQFVGVFAQKQHPLVLFLDDLQWADAASLALIEDLLTHPAMRFLLVIGAYRESEVSAAHPLMVMVNGARQRGAHVRDIVLGPLTDEPIAQSPVASGAVQLDTLSVLKASQAISSEILLDSLMKTLLCTVIENAGAQNGLLFLTREEELVLAAEAHVEGEQVLASLQSGSQPLQASRAPASILDHVRRSRETLVLADARADHPFSEDDYLRQHAPKSVLCLPILSHGELSGLLYLEKNGGTQAFTPERLAVLELLASQAAISLENAQLYADLKLENWEAEAELLEREAHMRRLVDSNIIGIFFWDFNTGIFDANDAFLQITGYTRADVEQGRLDWAAMTPPEYAAADEKAVQELRENGTALQYEKEYFTKDGKRVPVLVGGALLEGSRETGIAFVLDLTERKRADAELRARQAADAANEAKSQFLANMSHELRTPLNAILGYAQLLLNDAGRDARTMTGLETIRQSGELLLTLINDILDVSAIEAGKMVLYPEPVDLQAFLQAVTSIVRIKADQKHLRLTLHAAPGLARIVHVDEKRLRQVLLNLLSNAVKFTDAGEVQLRVYPLGAADATVRLRFEVKDSGSGIGIGPDQVGTIFEPFVQAPGVQRRYGGSGLGLAISRHLLSLMGSDIHVDSRVGTGSCFRFDLELPVENELPHVPAVAQRRIVTGYTGARRRLLVVDDIETNRMSLLALLAPLGFEVFAADDGQKGVNLAQTLRPDLILMDAVMPGMDGLEATRRLRAMTQTRNVPIIIVSAGTTPEDRKNGLEVGANAFLPKPLDMLRLLEEIGILLELTWLTEPSDAQAESAAAQRPMVAPPAQELEALYQLAKIGNMRQIRERAEQLGTLNHEYRGFADTLVQMASRFQSKAILELVTLHLEEAAKR
jgi:PAS domain S-box-containing protein